MNWFSLSKKSVVSMYSYQMTEKKSNNVKMHGCTLITMEYMQIWSWKSDRVTEMTVSTVGLRQKALRVQTYIAIFTQSNCIGDWRVDMSPYSRSTIRHRLCVHRFHSVELCVRAKTDCLRVMCGWHHNREANNHTDHQYLRYFHEIKTLMYNQSVWKRGKRKNI